MKVRNMVSNKGNTIANQFVISDATLQDINGEWHYNCQIFQSYDSIIVVSGVKQTSDIRRVYLDRHYWDYSVTTGKYRNIFLGETKAETQKKIDSGEYILTDLNSEY